MKIDFNGKVALVTGGAGGIGIACVKNLLCANAIVAVVDISEEALTTAEKELSGMGTFRCYQLDVTEIDMIGRVVDQICAELGTIEILIQTAGLLKGQNGLKICQKEWDQMFEINTRGTFFTMQQVVERCMKYSGGSIVNFASMAGIRGMRVEMASSHYSASKGAVVAMSMQAATEWAEYKVRCNAVAPGGVMTNAMAAMQFPEEALDPIPLRKLSRPEDIANLVTFLVSDKAAMVTGQTLVIDGGSSIVGY